MISWAALNRKWRGLDTPPKRKRKPAPLARARWAGLRARLRKVLRRMRREENMTPRFEKLRALLTRLERRA